MLLSTPHIKLNKNVYCIKGWIFLQLEVIYLTTKGTESRLEIRPSGLFELFIILFLGLICIAAAIVIGIKFDSSEIRIALPASGFVGLGLVGLGLIAFGIMRFIIILDDKTRAIIFTDSGIVFHNLKHDVLFSFKWEEIENIIISLRDSDKRPLEISIITTKKIEKVDLKLYDSIFTTRAEIWEKIDKFYEKYKIAEKTQF